MAEQLLLTLQITAVGMGLVFGAIILLWGLMALTVRLAAEKPGEAIEEEATELDSSAAAEDAPLSLKAKAAASAVVVMLQQAGRLRPLPPTAAITPWQAVMRSNQLNQKGPRR